MPEATDDVAAVLDDLHEQKRWALDAEVDFRTLRRALTGRPVKPLSMRRIRRVLKRRGLLGLLPRGALMTSKLAHRFGPNPWPPHSHECDARTDDGDGIVRPCLKRKEEHQDEQPPPDESE